MSAPVARTKLLAGFPNCLVFSAADPSVKTQVKDLNLGIFFEAEVGDDTIHAMIVDPRFARRDVEAYITELGGTVYS